MRYQKWFYILASVGMLVGLLTACGKKTQSTAAPLVESEQLQIESVLEQHFTIEWEMVPGGGDTSPAEKRAQLESECILWML